jgi:hypothetical protein
MSLRLRLLLAEYAVSFIWPDFVRCRVIIFRTGGVETPVIRDFVRNGRSDLAASMRYLTLRQLHERGMCSPFRSKLAEFAPR